MSNFILHVIKLLIFAVSLRKQSLFLLLCFNYLFLCLNIEQAMGACNILGLAIGCNVDHVVPSCEEERGASLSLLSISMLQSLFALTLPTCWYVAVLIGYSAFGISCRMFIQLIYHKIKKKMKRVNTAIRVVVNNLS